MTHSLILRGATIAFGALVLTAAGSAAATADDTDHGSSEIDVNVTVEAVDAGTLALTVDAASTNLTESANSTDLVREYTGTLPTVTVTDTRSADDIPDGAFWYVLGTASDFAGTQYASGIDASYLGWSPQLVDDPENGAVEVGGDVITASDAAGAEGLKYADGELLYLADTAAGIDGGGTFSATADLFLRIPADTSADTYSSVLTLSLFE